MSSTPTPNSPVLKKDNLDTNIYDDRKAASFRRRAFEQVREATKSRDVLLFLIAYRILNALTIKTFFQPDEYFQSLEPAWDMAFGSGSGAWITWVSLFVRHDRRMLTAWDRSGKISFDPPSTLPSLLASTGFRHAYPVPWDSRQIPTPSSS